MRAAEARTTIGVLSCLLALPRVGERYLATSDQFVATVPSLTNVILDHFHGDWCRVRMGLSKPIQQLQSEFAECARQLARHDSAISLCLKEMMRSFMARSACHGRKLICQFRGKLGKAIKPRQSYPAHLVGHAQGNGGVNLARLG
jgi:hypothetical protein